MQVMQDSSSGLSILHMNSDVAQTVNFSSIIQEFAKKKIKNKQNLK
jgi:hypothetical protein